MQRSTCASLVVAALALRGAVGYPVYTTGSSLDTCDGISCAAVDCVAPFKYVAPDKAGTCCPLCLADEKDVPADRSWAKGLSGGVGMDNNADPVLCRDVVCPPLHCPEYDQMFDGRCCTKCKTATVVTPADLSSGYDRALAFGHRGQGCRGRGTGAGRARQSTTTHAGQVLSPTSSGSCVSPSHFEVPPAVRQPSDSARGCTDAAARLLPRPPLPLLAAPASSGWNRSASECPPPPPVLRGRPICFIPPLLHAGQFVQKNLMLAAFPLLPTEVAAALCSAPVPSVGRATWNSLRRMCE
ncbi:unnamed protein product [Prorocentrum cordatum]|uniref:Uncharacterized protein n=1 Tax=Prorocentrum cordatum TaxID=2364126 RepID=A0ABN9WNL2_9DINO|nr:unnamed protein product [Polarella glacialis]